MLRKRCKIRNFIFTQLLRSVHVTIASSCYVQPLLLVYFNLLLQWEVQALPVEWALLQLARVKNVDNTKGTATIITDHINLKSKVPQETYNFNMNQKYNTIQSLQGNNSDISCVDTNIFINWYKYYWIEYWWIEIWISSTIGLSLWNATTMHIYVWLSHN